MSHKVRFSRHGALAQLEIDNPPVNALSRAVIDGFDRFMQDTSATSVPGLPKDCPSRTVELTGRQMFQETA